MLRDLPTDLVPLTEEQLAIVDLVRTFADREIRPIAREVDEADTEVPWDIWKRASEVGITSFALPEEYGGGGFTDVFTQCLVQEELCAGDSGLGNFIGSSGFFAHPLMELGTDDQKERWLRPLTGDRCSTASGSVETAYASVRLHVETSSTSSAHGSSAMERTAGPTRSPGRAIRSRTARGAVR